MAHRTQLLRHRDALFVLTLLPGFLTGCKSAVDSTPQTAVTVTAERPQTGDISEHVLADATLFPLAQATISPKISAPVTRFYVQRGSKVKAGQLLAELENRDLSAQALDSQGQYTAAQATFEMQTKAQVPEDFAKAELDVSQAKAQLHLQEEIVAARKKLFDQGAIPGRDYDTAVAALAQSQSAYETAKNHLDALSRVSNQASKQLAQGQLSSAKGKYDAAEAQVSYSQVRSPISGVVTDRSLFPGETANAASPLVTVMDTSSLLAKVHLSQMAAQRLSLGDEASIIIPGADEPAKAKVSLISPALDPGSTTVEVWLKLGNSQGAYKAGTPVRVSILGRTVPRAVKVPLNAILTADDGTKSVMTMGDDGTAHKVAVQLGINDGDDVQVTQGLKGTEMIITQGAYGLSDGSKVTSGKPGAAEEGK
jgi:HlyD family secretion protein